MQTRIGQGVFHIFNRVFHRRGCKINRTYVNKGTIRSGGSKKRIFIRNIANTVCLFCIFLNFVRIFLLFSLRFTAEYAIIAKTDHSWRGCRGFARRIYRPRIGRDRIIGKAVVGRERREFARSVHKRPLQAKRMCRDLAGKRERTEKRADGEAIVAGRNAVAEAMKAGRPIDSLYVQRGEKSAPLLHLISQAKERGVAVKEADPRKLDHLCGGAAHQGVVALAAAKAFSTLEDCFALAQARGEPPFLVLCDGLEDPHNLGAVIRSAECAGAHGVVIPAHRSVGLTYAVGKASAGAVEHLPVVRVKNLADCLESLKQRGLWVYAADMDGSPWCETDFTGPVALVIGSEGGGIGRLVKEKSDFVVSLPIRGHVNSLNASVAAGVLCYEVCRQRTGIKAFDPGKI